MLLGNRRPRLGVGVPALASASEVADDPGAVDGPQAFSQVAQRVGVLGEHHDAAVAADEAGLKQLVELLGLGLVGRQIAQLADEAVQLGQFLSQVLVCAGCYRVVPLVGGGVGVPRRVGTSSPRRRLRSGWAISGEGVRFLRRRQVVIVDECVQPASALQHLAAALERAAHSVEARCEPAPVDGHDEAQRPPPAPIGQVRVVVALDVAVDAAVQLLGRLSKLARLVRHSTLWHHGALGQHALNLILAKGRPRGAEHTVAHRRVGPQPSVPLSLLLLAQVTRHALEVRALVELGDPLRGNQAEVRPQLSDQRRVGVDGREVPCQHPAQEQPVSVGEVGAELCEVPLHSLGRLRPPRRQAEQLQQIPDVVGVHLHRRGRRHQQHVPHGGALHRRQRGQHLVRRVRSLGATAAGMMGLVHEHQIPRGTLGQRRAMAAPPSEMRGRQQHRRGPPDTSAIRSRLLTPPVDPHQFAAVQPRDVEHELFVEFLLPLDQHRSRNQQQRCAEPARQQQLPQHQTCLDGLAQADLIGQQVRTRPRLSDAPRNRQLMRPRLHDRRHQPDTGAGARRVTDLRQLLKLLRRQRGPRLERIARRRRPIVRHELHQPVADGLRQRHGSPGGSACIGLAATEIASAAARRLAAPQFLELLRQWLAMVRPAFGTPRPVHAERLEVVLPARCRLVDAAAERHTIARAVGKHPELRMEVALPGLGTSKRNTVCVTRHANPDLEPPLTHQPRDDLKALACDLASAQRVVHRAVKTARQDIGQLRSAEQRVTVGLGQLRPHQQPDRAVVGDEPCQPRRCRHERRR